MSVDLGVSAIKAKRGLRFEIFQLALHHKSICESRLSSPDRRFRSCIARAPASKNAARRLLQKQPANQSGRSAIRFRSGCKHSWRADGRWQRRADVRTNFYVLQLVGRPSLICCPNKGGGGRTQKWFVNQTRASIWEAKSTSSESGCMVAVNRRMGDSLQNIRKETLIAVSTEQHASTAAPRSSAGSSAGAAA